MSCSHPSHKHRCPHSSRISPVSPQMWIMTVDNNVDNPYSGVRIASNVRLSPSVDQLWTTGDVAHPRTTRACGYTAPCCARILVRSPLSTPVHTTRSRPCTRSPHVHRRLSWGEHGLIHTFPTTYDDDYLENSMTMHTATQRSPVDHSRTLSTHTCTGGPA